MKLHLFTSMSENSSIIISIRKIIFEDFNDVDLRFNNDQIFQILKDKGMLPVTNEDWTIDEMEPIFKELCDIGLLRNIAQNFNTQWFKLFEPLEKIKCILCEEDNYLTSSEKRICQNASCGSIH